MQKEKIFVGQITQKAVLKYKNSFVIVKQEGGKKWILPGGRLNVGETAEAGLLREIKEELSVDAKIGKLISVYAYNSEKKNKSSKLFVFYTGRVLPKQKIVIKSEIIDIAYVSKKSDLKKYKMHENQKKVLVEFLG
jgi:ADP-ribose pyrophosphatase YjhB (NUDIX family)